jgi:hypothetical protein
MRLGSVDSWRIGVRIGSLMLVGMQAGAQDKPSPAFVSREPGNVFFAGQAVRFTQPGSRKRVHIVVTDYPGQTVKEGEFAANGVDLGVLPRGYYELRQAGEGVQSDPVAFVVVPHPHPHAAGRTATDAALSWLVPEKRYEEGAELLRRAGVLWVRDRMGWGEVEPERGKFTWGKYDRSADLQAHRGLQVVQVFHASPKWSRADGAANRFPDDLRDAYTFARSAALHYHGRVKAWEVWNEADIPAFSVDPGSEYAAFLKAMYLGFKSADPHLPITQVSFALPSERFGKSLVENGTAAYYDVYNYHVYDDPKNYVSRAQGHLARMAASGAAGRPVWLTEAGIPLPAVDGALTPEEKRRQAEFIPKSYVESLIHGTDRHFFFVFPPYLENGVAFGLLDADLKPTPGYAALATLTDALGAAKYRGEMVFRQPGLHLHVFDNGRSDTLVAWSDAANVIVPLPVALAKRRVIDRAQVRDVVGAAKPLNADIRGGEPRLTLSPSPIYLPLPYGTLTENLTPPLPTAGPAAAAPRDELHAIVLRLRLPEARADKSEEAFRLRSGQPAALEVQVYNFGKRPFTGTVTVRAPEGGRLNRGLLTVTHLPPMGRQDERLTLTPGAGAARNQLRAVAETAQGEHSSPAVVEIVWE